MPESNGVQHLHPEIPDTSELRKEVGVKIDQRSLGQLEMQAARVQAGLLQRPAHVGRQVAALKLARRQVDGDGQASCVQYALSLDWSSIHQGSFVVGQAFWWGDGRRRWVPAADLRSARALRWQFGVVRSGLRARVRPPGGGHSSGSLSGGAAGRAAGSAVGGQRVEAIKRGE